MRSCCIRFSYISSYVFIFCNFCSCSIYIMVYQYARCCVTKCYYNVFINIHLCKLWHCYCTIVCWCKVVIFSVYCNFYYFIIFFWYNFYFLHAVISIYYCLVWSLVFTRNTTTSYSIYLFYICSYF